MIMRKLLITGVLALSLNQVALAVTFDWLPWVESRNAAFLPVEEQDQLAAPLWETGQGEEANGKTGNALDTYEALVKRYPGSRYAAMATFRMAEIRERQGKYQKAFRNYERIAVQYPDYEDFNAVIESQYQVARTTHQKKTANFLFIPYRNYGAAVGYYESIVRNAPFSDYAPQSLMHVAEIHQKRKDVVPAVFALERIIENYPKLDLAADAYLELGDTYAEQVAGPQYDQGATRDAIAYYEDYLILYPEDDDAGKAENQLDTMYDTLSRSKLQLGRYYYKYRQNYQAARVFLNEAITVSPESKAATEARELLDKLDQLADKPVKQKKQKKFGLPFFKSKSEVDEDLPLDAFGSRADADERGVSVASEIRNQEEIEQPEEVVEAKDKVFGPLRFWKKKEKADLGDAQERPEPQPTATEPSN